LLVSASRHFKFQENETEKDRFYEIQGVLSRDEMKKIMAGSGGDCQGYLDYCNSLKHKNCCNDYVCANNLCQHPTMLQK